MTTLISWCLLSLASFAPVENVAVEIDAASITPEGPGITRQLGGKVSRAIEEQGVSVDDSSSNHLRIEVRRTGTMSYDVAFVVEVDGVAVEPELEHVTCNRCPLMRMDEAVVARIPEAIARMEQAAKPEPAAPTQATEPEPVAEDVTADPVVERDQPPRASKRGKVLGPMGFTGIAVGGLGLVAVAAGATLVASDPVVRRDDREPELEILDDQSIRSGRALLGAGAATTVVGVVLLAVDLTVLRRRRSELARIPMIVPSVGGLVITGRF